MRSCYKKLLFGGLLWCLSVTCFAQPMEARAVINTPQRAILSAELVAKVVRLPKSVGERFRKGDVLVKLDCQLYQVQHQKVQAEQRASELKLQNAQTLNNLNAIGRLEVDMAQADLDKINAELHMTELNTQRCEILAPYDGKVVNWLVKPHEIAGQHQQLLEIVGTRSLEAEIIVPAQWIQWLQVGSQVDLVIDELQHTVATQISHIGAVIDPASQTLFLRARVQNPPPGLLPGMSVTARFPQPTHN
jgi:RND family efflux transporter MFP subunit